MSMEERILAKASELIDQRVAEIMDATSAPRIVRREEYLSIDADAQEIGDPLEIPWAYAGQIQLSDNEVFVVPFVVESYQGSYLNDGVFIEPLLNGRSVFSTTRPSFNRQNNGGAVYLQKSWNLYVHPIEPPSESLFQIRAEFESCEIIQQSLTAPYPREVGEVDWPADAVEPEDVHISTSSCKSTTLLGVYTKDGQIYPGFIFGTEKVTSYTDPLANGGPHFVASSTYAPFTRIVSLINPP